MKRPTQYTDLPLPLIKKLLDQLRGENYYPHCKQIHEIYDARYKPVLYISEVQSVYESFTDEKIALLASIAMAELKFAHDSLKPFTKL